MRRFRTRLDEPALALLQARLTGEAKRELVRRAQRCEVSTSEFVRQLISWELDERNEFPVSRLLRLGAVTEKEAARREGVRDAVWSR